MERSNLIKLRDHLNGPLITSFHIEFLAKCPLGICKKVFPNETNDKMFSDLHPVTVIGKTLFDLDTETTQLLFGSTSFNTQRANLGYAQYNGLPSDQYLVAKNIDLFISKDSTEVILNTIRSFLTKYPDMRFTQALSSLNIIEPDGLDNFHDTNEEVIGRIPDEFRL